MRVSKGRDWWLRASSQWTTTVRLPPPPIMLWRTIQGGVNWWHWMEPSTASATSGLSATVCQYASLTDGRFRTKLVCVCPGHCLAPHSMWHKSLPGTTGWGDHGFACFKSRHEPHWAFQDQMGVWILDIDYPSFHCARCPRRVSTLVESMSCCVHVILAIREGHIRYQWCSDMVVSMFNRLIKYGHVPFGFTSMAPFVWMHCFSIVVLL